MPLTKVDYSKTVIYKIQHRDNDELLYVGSTTDFTRRKAEHKRRCNNANGKKYNLKLYKMIRDNGGFDCFNMTIIKEFPCQNKQKALAEEDRLMREIKANMNRNRAYITPEETVEYIKAYYEKNKDKFAERGKQYYENNKDKIAEHHKKYYENNKDKIAEQKKQYRLEHKGEIAEYHKQYYEKKKDVITTIQKQKMTCECGCVIRRCGLAIHKRTQKHQDLLNNK